MVCIKSTPLRSNESEFVGMERERRSFGHTTERCLFVSYQSLCRDMKWSDDLPITTDEKRHPKSKTCIE